MAKFIASEFDISFRVNKLMPRNVFQYFPVGLDVCNAILSSPELLEYFDKTKKLDLMIVDSSFPECAVPIFYKYNAKVIYFSTVSIMPYEHDVLGVAPESSAIPELELDPPQTPMTFLEKVFNALVSIHYRYEHWKFLQRLDPVIRDFMVGLDPKYKDMPFVGDLARDTTSLVLYTGDIVTDYPRSHPAMFVNVGGLHCKNGNASALPNDIKEFLGHDDDYDGFIYISLGSVVVSSNLPTEVRRVFFDTIESFPKLKFLWKWNGPFPDEKPKNLYLGKWFPQNDVLASPKIRGFVTQSGRQSMLESLCAGVPMIAFPVLGDQDVNANRLYKMGGNVVLELGTVTYDAFTAAVQKVAYDKGMRERIEHLQKILSDRPMPALETAACKNVIHMVFANLKIPHKKAPFSK